MVRYSSKLGIMATVPTAWVPRRGGPRERELYPPAFRTQQLSLKDVTK